MSILGSLIENLHSSIPEQAKNKHCDVHSTMLTSTSHCLHKHVILFSTMSPHKKTKTNEITFHVDQVRFQLQKNKTKNNKNEDRFQWQADPYNVIAGRVPGISGWLFSFFSCRYPEVRDPFRLFSLQFSSVQFSSRSCLAARGKPICASPPSIESFPQLMLPLKQYQCLLW